MAVLIQPVNLGDVPASSVLYIPFATYDANGASVTMTSFAATDIEIYKNGSVTQRASDNGYTLLDTDGTDFDGITGIHGFSVDLADNSDSGFYAVGSFYWVVVSAVTVATQTVNFIAATFRIVAAEAIAGKPKVDVDGWNGTAVATPNTAGYPRVDLAYMDGSASAITGLAELGVTIRVFFTPETWTTTTVTDNQLTQSDTDHWKGMMLVVTAGTYIGCARLITGFDAATDTITFTPALPGAPATNDNYMILPLGIVNVAQFGGTNITSAAGRPEVNVTHISGSAVSTSTAQLGVNAVQAGGTAWGSGAITANSIAASAITSAKLATGAITSAKFAADAIDAAAIATDAITSVELSAGAATEIATAVWATAARTLTEIDEDNTTLDLDATIRAAVGLAAANLDTQLTAIDDFLDTEIAAILADTNELQTDWANGGRLDLILDARASQTSVDDLPTNAELATALGTADDAVLAQVALVKAKTDSLTFTVAGQVDANIKSVKDTTVTGIGSEADPWGP